MDAVLRQQFPPAVYEKKRDMLHRVLTAGQAFSQTGKPNVFWVPGRIEVLGKHTDYAGGRSLLAATSRGFFFVAYPRQDDLICLVDVLGKRTLESRLHPDVMPKLGQWSNYAETVFRRVARNFTGLKGADIAFVSDLPQAAGMSSSSAMIVGLFLVLSRINGLCSSLPYTQNIQSKEDLGGYLGTIENGQTFGTLVGDKGVGTFGGSEDHTAILCCQPGKLSQYAYCPVRFEQVMDLPKGYVFAIGVSGVVAEKTGAAMDKYNRASQLAFEALRIWNTHSGNQHPHLAGAIHGVGQTVVRQALETTQDSVFGKQDLLDRFDHFCLENEDILPNASTALSTGDIDNFGAQVEQSQSLGVTLLKNQIPETVFLAKSAHECGAVAASAFGAGFGGSVWALVKENEAEKVMADWGQAYAKAFPEIAKNSAFFVSHAGPSAFELSSFKR